MALAQCDLRLGRGPLALALVLVLLAAQGARLSAGQATSAEYNQLLGFLLKRHPALVQVLVRHGMVSDIEKSIKKGQSVTILAPTDRAMAGLGSLPCPAGKYVDQHRVLTSHILKGRLLWKSIKRQAARTKWVTIGKDKLTKLMTSPPLLGITQGQRTLAFTRIIQPQVFATAHTAVHGVNRIMYICE